MAENNRINESDFLFYRGEDGNVHAQVVLGQDTVWMSQRTMATIFDKDTNTIGAHIKNIYQEGELHESATTSKNGVVQKEGNRNVERVITFYNLEMIIAVGYRVNSYKATKFRQWATRILNEYLIKGFVLDDERLKQGNKLFGKDHFKELLERVREIRSSERMFYEKVTDLYALSEDYDRLDPETKGFFKRVQAKLEYAIVGQTPSEIIKKRADSKMPQMGLKTWKNLKRDGKIMLSDVKIAKNYLSQDELKSLNTLVSAFLDHAEMLYERQKVMKMADWIKRLDKFLDFNEFKILNDGGTVKKDLADAFAEREYNKFKVFQDQDFKSDFNKFIEGVSKGKDLPTESDLYKSKKDILKEKEEPLSNFNNSLKTALNFNPNKKKGKECPKCGFNNEKDANYCAADMLDENGDIVPCGHSFIAEDGKSKWDGAW